MAEWCSDYLSSVATAWSETGSSCTAEGSSEVELNHVGIHQVRQTIPLGQLQYLSAEARTPEKCPCTFLKLKLQKRSVHGEGNDAYI